MRTLFVECDYSEQENPAYQRVNTAPLHYWHCNPFGDMPSNESQMARLLRIPLHLRAVGIPWFGRFVNGKTTAMHVMECSNTLNALTITQLSLTFTDCEDELRDNALLTRALEPLSAIGPSCNWNNCEKGYAWWGPYNGKIGTHSCPQTYECLNNQDTARVMRTIRESVPTVLHICPCENRPNWKPEYGTQNVYARIRQLVNYAASNGVMQYVFPSYKIPVSLRNDYVRHISQCLLDADRVFN